MNTIYLAQIKQDFMLIKNYLAALKLTTYLCRLNTNPFNISDLALMQL